MKCTIDNKYLPALRTLAQSGTVDEAGKPKPPSGTLRLIARDSAVKITTQLGEADLPSKVLEPGVLFVPAAPFLEATIELHTNYWIEVEASQERVKVNGSVLFLAQGEFAIFSDPATAPVAWHSERGPIPSRRDGKSG